ncbi:MAG: hypothetical protein EOM25_03165 [Deltaproteobacteria bacterium]|nr:hypothetical protein [Deltaproteobacteria bacterium]
MNQMVKAVLVRHLADLSRLNHSASERSVSLYGILKKDPIGEFRPNEIESMLKDVQRLPGVRSLDIRLENWNVSPRGTGWEIRAVHRRAAGPERLEDVRIDRPEDIVNVLQDMGFGLDPESEKP